MERVTFELWYSYGLKKFIAMLTKIIDLCCKCKKMCVARDVLDILFSIRGYPHGFSDPYPIGVRSGRCGSVVNICIYCGLK